MEMASRKNDHISLTGDSQVMSGKSSLIYEPLMSSHQFKGLDMDFLGKRVKAPLWISSMTGGGDKGGKINRIYAKVCAEHGIGMGLGSMRIAIEDPKSRDDFDLRSIIGEKFPLWGNLGIAQVEEYLDNKSWNKVEDICSNLSLDGLFIHINPMQEWVQDEGDRLKRRPIDVLKELKLKNKLPIMIKGVGQGIGPKSLKELASLNFTGIEFGAWGGTNFSMIEALRKDNSSELWKDLASIGQSTDQMLDDMIKLKSNFSSDTQVIISGGVRSLVKGMEFLKKMPFNSVLGMGWPYLKMANEKEGSLSNYIREQIKILNFLHHFTE